jgi:hypothetical protein
MFAVSPEVEGQVIVEAAVDVPVDGARRAPSCHKRALILWRTQSLQQQQQQQHAWCNSTALSIVQRQPDTHQSSWPGLQQGAVLQQRMCHVV